MTLPIEPKQLLHELQDMGLQNRILSDPLVKDIDLALGGPCYRAFFKIVDDVRQLESTWHKVQNRIADYKDSDSKLPRDLYLTFVTSQPRTHTDLAKIQSVVSDSTICRKLVLAPKPDELREALETLPFVAYESSKNRSAPRVQQFLAALSAKDYPTEILTLLAERSAADRILNRLLDAPTPSTVPFVALTDYGSTSYQDAEREYCRLSSLSIEDFRGIRKMDLDLSGAVTVIYGRNGTGKTSIVDALEWVILGSVERLEQDYPDDISDRSPYLNLFSETGIARVTATLRIDNRPVVLTRTLRQHESRGTLEIDGRIISDEHELLDSIIGPEAARLDLRNLRVLISSTHFLSQTTLKQFLSGKPSDRYWSLAHLLGTQDFGRLIDKAHEVRREAEKKATELKAQLEGVQKEKTLIDDQVTAASRLLTESGNSKDLSAKAAQLVNSLVHKLRMLNSEVANLLPTALVDYGEVQSATKLVAEWVRAAVREQRLLDSKLAIALKSKRNLPKLLTDQNNLTGSRTSTDAELEDLQRQTEEKRAVTERVRAELAALASALARLTSEIDGLHEISKLITEMDGIQKLRKEQEDELSLILPESQRLNELYNESASLVDTQRRTVLAAENQLSGLKEKLGAIADAQSVANECLQLLQEKPSVEQQLELAIQQEAAQQLERQDLGAQSSELSSERKSIEESLKTDTASLQRYKQLLAELQQFVTDSVCPLCGHDWQDSHSLSEHVKSRTDWTSPRWRELRSQLEVVNQRSDVVEKAIKVSNQQLARIATTKNGIMARLKRIEAIVDDLREKLSNLGVTFDVVTLTNDLASARHDAEREASAAVVELSEHQSTLRATIQRAALAQEDSRRLSDRMQRLTQALRESDGRISRVRQLLNKSGFDWVPSLLLNVQDRIRDHSQEIGELRGKHNPLEADFSRADSELKQIEFKKEAILRKRHEQDRTLGATEESIRRITQDLVNAGFGVEASEDQILEHIKRCRDRLTQLDNAQSDTDQLRQISTWLIAQNQISRLGEKSERLAAQVQALGREMGKYQNWHDHLSTLAVSITSTKAEVEALQLDNYEPTINRLYQRLNAHPLFGKIRMAINSKEQSVKVNVELNPILAKRVTASVDGLGPLRYLSEAQLNVLALSIFLSHSFQQRWSNFSPVLLDDPVQDMDDFNANGFIDWLRAFSEARGQFVISTCDIGFYRLALLKLGCLNKNGSRTFRAYRLEGISADGPQYVQDVPAESFITH